MNAGYKSNVNQLVNGDAVVIYEYVPAEGLTYKLATVKTVLRSVFETVDGQRFRRVDGHQIGSNSVGAVALAPLASVGDDIALNMVEL